MTDTPEPVIEERTVFNVLNHTMVPHHEVVPEEERAGVFEHYGAAEDQFPKILSSDPGARACGARPGDVVKVVRESPTAGEAVAYRLCVEFA